MDEHNSCKLTQDMLLTPNTKYVIKYNYDVQENITMPQDSILMIDGGKLYSSTGTKTITGVQNSYDVYDTLLITVIPYDQCVDTDSVTLARFTENSESGTIDPSRIPSQSIDTTKLADGAVTEPTLANSAVTENKIANSAITSNKIAANAVSESNIAGNAVTESKVANNAITENKIAKNAVTSEKIASGAVTENKIASNVVTRAKIADGAVTTSKIADYAVGADQIAQGAVGTGHIASGSVISNSLANNSVVQEKIRDGAVSEEKLAYSVVNRINNTYTKAETYPQNSLYTKTELYTKSDLYTKSEIGEIVSRTPETDVVILDYTSPDTPLDALDDVPAADRANKLFRIRNTDDHSFSEYAWDGSNWVIMADKDYAIDDEPQDNDNVVTGSGLLNYFGKFRNNNNDIVYAITDEKGRICLALYKDGSAYIPGLGIEYIQDVVNRVEIITDSQGKILSYRDKEGTLFENAIEVKHLSSQNLILGESAKNYVRDLVSNSGGQILAYPDGWQWQETENIKIACKKADSMTSLKWTPKKACPTRNLYSGEYFPAGTEVTGVPYGHCYENGKRIGIDVSLETFMTAVNNPYSLLYTEGTCATNGFSAWNITYHGSNDWAGPYYANVCSEFTDYCLGIKEGLLAHSRKYMCTAGVYFGQVIPQSAQAVRIGDLLNRNSHCALIRNVKYNESGRVEKVIVSEQATKFAYQTEYTAEALEERMESSGDVIYRPVFKINPDLTMFEFDEDAYVYNNDICTFAGNKACFKTQKISDDEYLSELIVLDYNLDDRDNFSYTAIEVYKDDDLLQTYPITTPQTQGIPQDQVGRAFKLPNTLGYGNYKARLTGNNTQSDYTYFKVVETNVKVTSSEDGVSATVEFSSSNATPVSVDLCYCSSSTYHTYGYYILNEEEKQAGTITLSPSTFAEIDKLHVPSEYWCSEDYFDINEVDYSKTYEIRVYFETEYGRISNTPISVTFVNPNS